MVGDGEYKMVLVVRGELRLTPGKAAVQAAHGAVMLVLEAQLRRSEALDRWLDQGQKKIALEAPNLETLEDLRRRAVSRGILAVFVVDAGLTEVAPGTRTCLGLGPAPASEIDPLTGGLPLL